MSVIKKHNILINSVTTTDGKKIDFHIRESDGYINASRMCSSAGKSFGDYSRLKQSETFFQAMAGEMQICMSDLVQINRNDNNDKSTWIHKKVALHLASWLSPIFLIHIYDTYEMYLKGELKPLSEQDLSHLEKNEKSIFNEDTNDVVRACNVPHMSNCYLYVRGVNDYLFDYDSPLYKSNTGTRLLSKNLLKFGIADSLSKRAIGYGKDNGTFYYAFKMKSRIEAKHIEDIFRTTFKNLCSEKSFEYLEVQKLVDYYKVEIPTDINQLRFLGGILFSDILIKIHLHYPENVGKYGSCFTLTQGASIIPFLKSKPTNIKPAIVDIENMEHKEINLDWNDLEDAYNHAGNLFVKCTPEPVTLKKNYVMTMDAGTQCSSELIDAAIQKLKIDACLLQRSGSYAEKDPLIRTNTAYIQKIDKDDLTKVIHIYRSYKQAGEENNASSNQIKDAVRDARIVNGARWNYIPYTENVDTNVVPDDFPKTVLRREKNTGEPVCMLHPFTKKIERIYSNQKQASIDRNVTPAAIKKALVRETLSSGQYWVFLRNATAEEIVEYENRFGKWIPPVAKRDKIVCQIDPNNNMVIKEFSSYSEVADKINCASRSISHAVENKKRFRGFFWKVVDNRPI